FNYGPTSFDRRHIFVTTSTYRLPFFRRSKGIFHKVLGGWELSTITRLQSGPLLTVIADTDIGTNRRANYDGSGLYLNGNTLDRWFNISAFSSAGRARQGTSGVRIVEGPGRHIWNISPRKNFSITERLKGQLQGSFYNAFNRPNFNAPNTDFNS